jgi:surfeit locus 1 family protein
MEVVVRFRPALVPTLFMLLGVALTWSLGVWQLGRHQEKSELKQAILQGLDGQVLNSEALDQPIDDIAWRKIEVQGHYLEPMWLTAARKELGHVGYGVVQGFQVNGGPALLVDRGWVPRDGLEPLMAQIQAPPGTVTLEGQIQPLVMTELKRALPAVQGLPERFPPGAWPTLWQRLPEPRLQAVVPAGRPVLAGEGKDPTHLPIDGYDPLPRLTDSLSYAFQWWIFGTILLIVWGALGVHRGRQLGEDSGGADALGG